jgi:hypothetical protein
MARQVGPQERKPEHSRALKARDRDEDVLGEFHQGPAGFGLREKAGYKTAASTSLRHHIKISLANRAVSI